MANVYWKHAKLPIKDLGASYVDANGDLCYWNIHEAREALSYLARSALTTLKPVESLSELRQKAYADYDESLPLGGYTKLAQITARDLGYAPYGIESCLRALELHAQEHGEEIVMEALIDNINPRS